MRRKSKAKTDNVLGIRHRDLVSYTYKNGETHTGYVTALYPEQLALNFQSKTKHCKKVNARKCKLLWKFNKIYWLEQWCLLCSVATSSAGVGITSLKKPTWASV